MKKFIAIFVTLIMMIGLFSGCSSDTDTGSNSEYSDRPITITLAYTYGGYGKEFIEAMAKDFMDNYDQTIYLKVKDIHDVRMRDRIQAKTPDGDICMVSVDMFNNSNCLENLDSIYNAIPLGESKTIAEKIGSTITAYYTESTGKYQLPSATYTGFNWVYNKTVLDGAFGAGNYQLPRTTEEFFEFGTTLINDKGIYLTSGAFNDAGGGDYLAYAFQTWFAQMIGLEAYNNFNDGLYYDTASSSWKLSEDSPMVLSTNKDAIESAYGVAYKLCDIDNNYLHTASQSINYIQNDIVFAGGGYMSQQAKTAFLYTGNWYEKEIQSQVDSGRISKNEYGVIKSPVNSDIVKRLEYRDGGSYMTDATLRLLIDAIDNGETSYTGVSAKDFAIVKEARAMFTEQICAEIVVPTIKDETKRDAITKVIQYIASDHAQEIAVKTAGVTPMYSFGYQADYDAIGASNFVKEYAKVVKDAVAIDYACVNKLFKQSSGLNWYRGTSGGILAGQIYEGNAYAVNEIYDKTYNYYNGAVWDNIIEVYKEKIK